MLGLLVVGVAFAWALPTIAPYAEVWSELAALSSTAAAVIAVVAAANLVAPSTAQRAALPGLRLGDAVTVDWTTSAVANTVPGGSAVAVGMTWSMYRSYGLERSAIARSVVVTGVWDTFVKFGTPLLAVIWLSAERPVGPGLVRAAAIGTGLFAVVVSLGLLLLVGPRVASSAGAILDRLPATGRGWPERLVGLRSDTVALLEDRWARLTFWTVAGHANLYLLLVVCLRAVGVSGEEASLAAILAAFAFGRLVTALPLSPGGLGVMELSLTGALAAVTAAGEAEVVAAVLLFRFLTFVLPIPLGAISWMAWTSRPHSG